MHARWCEWIYAAHIITYAMHSTFVHIGSLTEQHSIFCAITSNSSHLDSTCVNCVCCMLEHEPRSSSIGPLAGFPLFLSLHITRERMVHSILVHCIHKTAGESCRICQINPQSPWIFDTSSRTSNSEADCPRMKLNITIIVQHACMNVFCICWWNVSVPSHGNGFCFVHISQGVIQADGRKRKNNKRANKWNRREELQNRTNWKRV